MSKNKILSKELGKALADALAGNTILTKLDLSDNQHVWCNSICGAEFAQELAVGIKDNGTLSSLNLASNDLGAIVGWTHHRYMAKDYLFMHSDGRHQKQLPEGEEIGKPEGLIAIANAIPDMRAISQFTFSGDDEESEPVTMETSMVEADFSKKGLGVSGAIMLSAFLPKCM
jgi:hypothetical protein